MSEKKEKTFPSGTVWASSAGELLDSEFDRLTQKMSIDKAAEEINRMGDYNLYWHSVLKKPLVITDRAISNAYSRAFDKQKEKAFEYIKTQTKYDGKSTVSKVVEKLHHLLEPVLENPKQATIAGYGICHWLWQVKRRIFGLKVENHLVIGFINEGVGEDGQGSGKTTFVKNICKPFLDPEDKTVYPRGHEQFLFADTDLSELTDKRVWGDILKKPIIFLDDVSPESKADAAIFKSLLSTNGSKSARPLYGKHLNPTEVLFSAIVTANADNFGNIIKDTTGNRRFLPIKVKNFKEYIPADFDFLPFWKMINEKWPCFVNQKMFQETQQEHMTQTSLELLLDQYDAAAWKKEVGGDCVQVFARDIKLVLNKLFPKEKNFSTTQSVTKEMKRLGYDSSNNGGPKHDSLVYFVIFKGNSFDRWQQNFGKDGSENPDRRSPFSL